MSRVICVASGKGGVGKTTITANLGLALADMGYKTVAVDANLTAPNLGFHLGVPLYPITLHDVLRGDAKIADAIFTHHSGLKIVPAGLSFEDVKDVDTKNLAKVAARLAADNDMVFLDGAAGLGAEAQAGIRSADELLVVTNPDLPSVTDALKTVKISEEIGTKILGVVLNKVSGYRGELEKEDVESLLGRPVISQIPLDEKVAESIAAKNPIIRWYPYSNASNEMRRLAASLVGARFRRASRVGLLARALKFLSRQI